LDEWSHRTTYTPKKICKISAKKKFGNDRPTKAPAVLTLSNHEYCRNA